MTKWTTQQTEAIGKKGNLLVAAAAGSGKTAVLTERIVEKIREGTPVRALLVVTFTKAAAGEMKKRVSRVLLEYAKGEKDAAAKDRLLEAAEQIPNAAISTLHSFCMQVLRRHFYEAGLDPAFRVADDAEAAILLEDALEDMFEAKAGENGFETLCAALGTEDKLKEAIKAVYGFMQAQPQSEAWLRRSVDLYDTDEGTLAASELVKSALCDAKLSLEATIEEMEALCGEVENDFPQAAAFGRAETEKLRSAMRQEDYARYGAALDGFVFERLSGFPRGTSEEEKKPFMDARKNLKDVCKAQARRFSRSLQEEAERMRRFHPLLCELQDCILAMRTRYDEAKRERAVVDYSDMEHICLSLLEKSEIGGEYRKKYRYIFVDEYQDSNRVQEAILQSVKRADNLFMVGDVKQSIYRFRQAEPSLFTEKYADPSSFMGEVVDLNRNFRSSGAVVDTVNAVFSRVLRDGFGGVEYDARSALVLGRADGAKGEAELTLLSCEDEEDDQEEAEIEARYAAERIREIMANELYSDPKSGSTRPYRYGDFAVLHRSPKRVAEHMTRILASEGIPAYAELSGGYFEAVEVQVFMNLLRVIDNRRQDIPLISVLRSMIGGFSDEELSLLRAPSLDGGEWVDLLGRAARKDDALGKKAEAFLEKLDEWYEESRMVSVASLCGELLDASGYGEYCAALPGGKVRKLNLEALLARAQSYEKGEARSLSGFIALMDRVKNTDKIGAATALGADVVRLLSTHKSKGLEFPVVIVAGLSKRFNEQEKREDVALNAGLGIGLRVREGTIKRDTLARQAILSKNARESLEEEARILYVAMTRAQEKLILLYCKKDPLHEILTHTKPLTGALCARARCEGDYLLSAVLSIPEGNELRAYAKLPVVIGKSTCALHARVLLRGKAAEQENANAARAALQRAALEADETKYADALNYQYPYLVQSRVPGKLSVSELIGNYRSLRPYPDFIAQKRGVAASERGTAAHLVMETIPIAEQSVESVYAQLRLLVESGRLSEAQAHSVHKDKIVNFFSSPLGRRMRASSLIERERQFNYRVSAREAGVADTDEPVLLQGVIDCCFLEDGEWVVIDYKTDYVPEGASGFEVAKKHQRQLGIYAAALAALTQKGVKACYIHLLYSGESVELPL